MNVTRSSNVRVLDETHCEFDFDIKHAYIANGSMGGLAWQPRLLPLFSLFSSFSCIVSCLDHQMRCLCFRRSFVTSPFLQPTEDLVLFDQPKSPYRGRQNRECYSHAISESLRVSGPSGSHLGNIRSGSERLACGSDRVAHNSVFLRSHLESRKRRYALSINKTVVCPLATA